MVEQLLQGLGIAVPAGEKLSVWRGDTVRTHVSFDYRGSALTGLTLRCSIGQRRLGVFDEITFGRAKVYVNQ